MIMAGLITAAVHSSRVEGGGGNVIMAGLGTAAVYFRLWARVNLLTLPPRQVFAWT